MGLYTYNGLGQRVKKNNGEVRLFVYDEAGRLVGEYDGAGTPVRETVWLNGAELAVMADDTANFVHTDHLNTPRAVTSGAGTVIWRWDSDPFGTTAPDEDPDGDQSYATYHSRFPGQYFDTESGLHYNAHRDYWPGVGRYVQSDPIGLAGGLNTYLYANGNPIVYTDPTRENPGAAARLIPPTVRVVGGGALACALSPDLCAEIVGLICQDVADGVRDTVRDVSGTLRGLLPPFMTNKKGERPPSNSKPISETPWSGDHQPIKEGVGAAPDNVVVIDPRTDDVWVRNPDDSWTNHGPAGTFTGPVGHLVSVDQKEIGADDSRIPSHHG